MHDLIHRLPKYFRALGYITYVIMLHYNMIAQGHFSIIIKAKYDL